MSQVLIKAKQILTVLAACVLHTYQLSPKLASQNDEGTQSKTLALLLFATPTMELKSSL